MHAEVFWTCATHALSTEREEVMGLLLGDVLVRCPALPPTQSARLSAEWDGRDTHAR